mgnify:FL=1
MNQSSREFKVGDLVTVNAIATITSPFNDSTGNYRITFDNGNDVYVPYSYLVPVPTTEYTGR